jgi:hypothetical protein
MRFRMKLIFGLAMLILTVGTATVMFKQSGAAAVFAREKQPLAPLK